MKKRINDMLILKITTLVFVCTFMMALMSSCTSATSSTTGNDTQNSDSTLSIEDYYDDTDTDESYKESSATKITLSDDGIAISGSGASSKNGVVTISASGTYVISGSISSSQIIVDNITDKNLVHIILAGASITCKNSSPIYIVESERTVITLKENTQNTLTDSSSYTLSDLEKEEPDAAIFSKDTLTINGSGSLVINANYNHGIHGKDDLRIINTNITVNSVNDAIKGRDSVIVLSSVLNLNAGGDGIQSNNTGEEEASDEEKSQRLYGIIIAKDSEINITAASDGIQAVNYLYIISGKYYIKTAGGSVETTVSNDRMFGFGYNSQGSEDDSASAKALKSDVELVIDGGEFEIDSNDDALHSNKNVTVNGGVFNIYTSDDGMHADETLTINAGDIDIARSYEGLEGNNIYINGANISLKSSDDGVNSAGSESETAEANPNRGGMMNESGNSNITISGGTLYINAGGDGIDANGIIYINGGTVTVDGPTDSGNGAIDFYNGLEMNGGVLIAVGSTGMAEGVTSAGSGVCALDITLSSTQSAGTLISIKDESGNEIISYSPQKTYQSVIICTTTLKKNNTYNLYLNDSLYQSFTITESITSIGSSGNMNTPGGGMMQNNNNTPPSSGGGGMK